MEGNKEITVKLECPALDRLVELVESQREGKVGWEEISNNEQGQILVWLRTFDRLSPRAQKTARALLASPPSTRPSPSAPVFNMEEVSRTASRIITHPMATEIMSMLQAFTQEKDTNTDK